MFKASQELLAGFKLNGAGYRIWSTHKTSHRNFKPFTNSTKFMKNRGYRGTQSSGIGRHIIAGKGYYKIDYNKVRHYVTPENYNMDLKPLVDHNFNKLHEKWDLNKYAKEALSSNYYKNLVLKYIKEGKQERTAELITQEDGVLKGKQYIKK